MGFKKSNTKEEEFTYEVIEECGTISTKGDWETKLRYMKWGKNDPKYDIRAWKTDEDGKEQCRKGLSITGEELESLQKLLNKMNRTRSRKAKNETEESAA